MKKKLLFLCRLSKPSNSKIFLLLFTVLFCINKSYAGALPLNNTVNLIPPSTDASLSKILLSTGSSLTKTTGPSNLNYSASVNPGTTAITVKPFASNANAIIKVNNVTVVSGSSSQSIALTTATTVINIIVTAQDGVTKQTTAITVTRNGLNDASLRTVTVSTQTNLNLVPGSTLNFTTLVPSSTTALTVNPVSQDAYAVITVNGQVVASGGHSQSITLNPISTVIYIMLTAEDGLTTNTYTITVNKIPSSNSSLSTLALNTGATLTSTSVTSYTASVPAGTTSVSIKPTAQDQDAVIKVNGTTVATGTFSPNISLNAGTTAITVALTSQDGTTTHNYTVTISRNGSSNASLSTIALSSKTPLALVSGPSDLNYTTSVSPATASLSVVATAQDPTAVIKVNGTVVASGINSPLIPLTTNSTVISIVVTAQDGVTVRHITLTVDKSGSSNAGLTALSISNSATLNVVPGSSSVNYTATATASTASVTVKTTTQEPTAVIKVNGVTAISGTASQAIALTSGGVTNINIVVTAPDGVTVKTYTIQVIRASSGAFVPTNATFAFVAEPVVTSSVLVHPAVSPNGDGINDFLLIEGINAHPDNKLLILNRNGNVVYETVGYDNSTRLFDGHSNKNGALQKAGTYLYVLDYTDAGVNKHLTGYIELKY